MRLSTTTVGELALEIDRAVEAQLAIVFDVDVQRLEIGRRVDDTNIARLHEVVCNDEVLLVGSDFDIVRANGRLVSVRVVKALDVVEVGDIECGDVVSGGQGDCWRRCG